MARRGQVVGVAVGCTYGVQVATCEGHRLPGLDESRGRAYKSMSWPLLDAETSAGGDGRRVRAELRRSVIDHVIR